MIYWIDLLIDWCLTSTEHTFSSIHDETIGTDAFIATREIGVADMIWNGPPTTKHNKGRLMEMYNLTTISKQWTIVYVSLFLWLGTICIADLATLTYIPSALFTSKFECQRLVKNNQRWCGRLWDHIHAPSEKQHINSLTIKTIAKDQSVVYFNLLVTVIFDKQIRTSLLQVKSGNLPGKISIVYFPFSFQD